SVQTVQLRHCNFCHNHIRVPLLGEEHEFMPVLCRCHYVVMLRKDRGEPLGHNPLIIGEKNPVSHALFSWLPVPIKGRCTDVSGCLARINPGTLCNNSFK